MEGWGTDIVVLYRKLNLFLGDPSVIRDGGMTGYEIYGMLAQTVTGMAIFG
jgi:hypothetical protein